MRSSDDHNFGLDWDRGFQGAIVSGLIGVTITVLVGLGFNLCAVPEHLIFPVFGVGIVFAATGWATYAPKGNHRFASTLVIITVASVASWFILSIFQLTQRHKEENPPLMYPFEAFWITFPPAIAAIVLSWSRSKHPVNGIVSSSMPRTLTERDTLESDTTTRYLSLSWAIGGRLDSRGGNKPRPEWTEVESRLEQLKTLPGTVGLDVRDGPEIGPRDLQVRAEYGYYLLTLGEVTRDDYNVRSLTNEHEELEPTGPITNVTLNPGQIEILGDLWDSRLVCTDFAIVMRVFKEFFDTGDVSHDILD